MADIITTKFLPGFRLIAGDALNAWKDQINAAFASLFSAPSATGTVTALNATATTAGGATAPALAMGTAGVGIYFGSGLPTITAAKGSLYLRTDGSSTSTRLYVNTDGATTWTDFTSAA